MLRTRIIPCLLLRDGGLVKTVKFNKHKYVGDPINAVKIFNEKEVDELIFIDIDASREKREPNYSLIKDITSECFMPFSYGGGISTCDQISKLLRLGVEKVIINQRNLKGLDFLKEAAARFGNSTIVAAIDVKKDFFGKYHIYDHVKCKRSSFDLFEFINALADAGAGEIFVNNVDRDGTGAGFDIALIEELNSMLSIPLIACGGASGLDDIRNLIEQTDVSGVAAGSIFVFQGPHKAVLISYPTSHDFKKYQLEL